MQQLPEKLHSAAPSFHGASSMPAGISEQLDGSSATITTMFTEGIPTMVPPSKDASPSTIIDFVNNQLDRIGTELEVLDGLRLLGGGLSQRMQGGQAVVQMARHSRSGLEFAIKFFVHTSTFHDESAIYQDRISGLGQFAEHLKLPRVTYIEDNTKGVLLDPSGYPLPPFIVMERGESLDRWSERAKPDVWQSVSVVKQTAERLKALHAAGYVHRDLKPANVMWLPCENRWTVIDFGCTVPKQCQRQPAFSVRYAAPEAVTAYRQVSSMAVSESLDAWSLGVLAYELLIGAAWTGMLESTEKMMDRIEGKNGMSLPWESPLDRSTRRKVGVFKPIVWSLLSRDAAKRPSMAHFVARCDSVLSQSITVTSGPFGCSLDEDAAHAGHVQLHPSSDHTPTLEPLTPSHRRDLLLQHAQHWQTPVAGARDRPPQRAPSQAPSDHDTFEHKSQASSMGTSSAFVGEDIFAHLTASPDGTCMSVHGRTFHIPESSSNSPFPHAWASFPMFPVHRTVEKSNVNTGLFSLKRATVGASMRSISGHNKGLSDARFQMGPKQCIVLDAGCQNFQFQHVTFTGGVLVCAGQGCTVELTNVTLSQTVLVATAGATVALNRCQLTCSHTSGQPICLISSGTHTRVKTRECSLVGGLVGAAAHAAAHLDAKRTVFNGSELIAVEVRGAGAKLSMAENCRIEDMGRAYRGPNAGAKGYSCRGIYAHASAAVDLRGLTVRNAEWGLHVRDASVQAKDCSISKCSDVCVRATRGAQVALERSVLDHSLREGLWASHQGTQVQLTASSLLKNRVSGCMADEEANVRVLQCLTGGNGTGFFSQSKAQVKLKDTGMKGDTTGCRVQGTGSLLTAESAVAWDCKGVGYCVALGGTMRLQTSSAVRCGCSGVQANDEGSRLTMRGGMLEGNKQCGVVVWQGAEGSVTGAVSRGSRRAGFGSTGSSSKLLLQECVGEDAVGCEEEKGGTITIRKGCSFKNRVKVAAMVPDGGDSSTTGSSDAADSGKGKRGLHGWLSGKR